MSSLKDLERAVLDAQAARIAQWKVMDETPGKPAPVGPYTSDGYLEYTEPGEDWTRENRKLFRLIKKENKAHAKFWAAHAANLV